MIRWSQDDLTPLPALPVGWPTVRSSNNPRNTIFPSNDAPLSQSNVMSADTQQAPKERKWGRKVHRLVIRAKYSLLSFRRSLVLLCGVVCVVCVVSVMTATATDHPMIWRKRHAVALDTTQLWHHLHGIPSGYTRTGFVGHRSADVDSVCAAVAMAHLFGGQAFMAGGVHTQDVSHVLRVFNITQPLLTTSENVVHITNWFLVDHNQAGKVPPGVDLTSVVGVVDHHTLMADAVAMALPGYVVLRAWGSTCAIVTALYIEYGVSIPTHVGGCLLSGIVSDTLLFTSPTTTPNDMVMAGVAEQAAGVNATLLATDLFRAKSNLETFSAHEIVQMDMKRYDCENGTYAVSVVETLTPLALLLRKEDLLRALREIKHSEGLQYLIFCVVDLVVLQSYMFAISAAEQSLIEQAFGLSDVRDIGEAYTLTAVSRKKQIVPALEKAIATVRGSRV